MLYVTTSGSVPNLMASMMIDSAFSNCWSLQNEATQIFISFVDNLHTILRGKMNLREKMGNLCMSDHVCICTK